MPLVSECKHNRSHIRAACELMREGFGFQLVASESEPEREKLALRWSIVSMIVCRQSVSSL